MKYFVLVCLLKSIFAQTLEENLPFNDESYAKRKVLDNCGERGGFSFNRIVGGSEAENGEFPWQVSLQFRNDATLRPFCGAAIVHKNWVITAAHCIDNIEFDELRAVAGAHDFGYRKAKREQVREVTRAIVNNFDFPTFYNDIALLKVNPSFDFNGKFVKPICLPDLHQNFTGLGTIAGWGRTDEDGNQSLVLRKATLQILEKNACSKHYHQMGYSRFFNDCQMCTLDTTGNRDACQGDSGGPLICQGEKDAYFLCGVVSWGIGCGRANNPGIYTKISCYTHWIQYVIDTK